MNKLMESIAEIIGRWAAFIAIAWVFSYPLMLLWNNFLLPAVTVLMPITAMQAWGIIVVSYIVRRPRGDSE